MKIVLLQPMILAGMLVSAATLSTNGWADEPATPPQDCWQTSTSQAAMDACANRELENTEQKLHDVAGKILEMYAGDSGFIDAFKASQKAWEAYRDAQIKMRYPHLEDHPHRHYGSVFPMCHAQYRASLAKARIAQLMQWVEGIPEGDVCAGSLKAAGDTQAVSAAATTTQAARRHERCTTTP